MRLIDAEAWKLDLLLLHGTDERTAWIINRINHAPTVDAVPVEWILNNERMPKEGRGREAIMDMLEDWRKEHDKAD